MRLLPNFISCNNCQKELPAHWKFTQNKKYRIAMAFAKCECGNMNIGAAGADEESLDQAIAIRRRVIDEANSVTRH
jgi:hypothetical protein